MLVSYLSTGLLVLSSALFVQARYIERDVDYDDSLKQTCTNTKTDFTQSMDNWVLQRGSTEENCKQTSEGLRMRLIAPPEYSQVYDKDEKAYFNNNEGTGCTLNATTYMQYGTFTATVKAGGEPGAVTAVILIADNGDEIDFELLATSENQITSNYFYGPHIVYGKNGKTISAPEQKVYEQFYTYKIEWSPKKITWYINGDEIRTTYKSDEYPTHPARVQIGLWDGSGAAGTARWAGGPIDWKKRNNEPVDAYIKDIEISCDPEYNIVN